MPASMATRVAGSVAIVVPERHLDTFKRRPRRASSNEARLLARFDHPSLVKVYRFWEENGTAYMVMPFYEGPTLKGALAELGHVPGEDELRAWLKPMLNAVTVLHDGGVWHQNIGPDEILLTPVGPVLFGFASAASMTIAALRPHAGRGAQAGFAAIEQYGKAAEAEARRLDRPLCAGRGDLRGDHRQRAGRRRRSARQGPDRAARCRSSPPACTARASSPRSTLRWRSSPSAGRRITGSSAP